MIGSVTPLLDRFRPSISGEAKIRLARMTETFVAEIGVLVAVFPVLDSFIATGHLSLHIIIYSFVGSVLCYSVAAVIAIFIGE